MLERDSRQTRHFGFLLSAELEDGKITPEQVLLKLHDALLWVEGIGEVQSECMGEMDIYEKEPDGNPTDK